MSYYKVVSPFLAVRKANQPRGFVTVPMGAIIEVSGVPPEPGLMAVKLGNEDLLVFTRDIRDRSEPLPDAIAPISGQAVDPIRR